MYKAVSLGGIYDTWAPGGGDVRRILHPTLQRCPSSMGAHPSLVERVPLLADRLGFSGIRIFLCTSFGRPFRGVTQYVDGPGIQHPHSIPSDGFNDREMCLVLRRPPARGGCSTAHEFQRKGVTIVGTVSRSGVIVGRVYRVRRVSHLLGGPRTPPVCRAVKNRLPMDRTTSRMDASGSRRRLSSSWTHAQVSARGYPGPSPV